MPQLKRLQKEPKEKEKKARKSQVTTKPEDMSEEEWSQLRAKRAMLTADRQNRRDVAAAAKAEVEQEAQALAYLQSQSQDVLVLIGTQHSSSACRSMSPSSPAFFEESGSPGLGAPRQFSSPEFGENELFVPDDGTEAYSPIVADAAAAWKAHLLDLNQSATDGSPALRRRPIAFDDAGNS